MFAVARLQRDVAAIVDVGAFKLRRIQHRAKNLSATEPATAAIGVMK